MFKSEIANRIISLAGFWIVVFIVLFSNNTVSDPIFWIIVVVLTAYHLDGIINYYKKNRNDSLK